MQSFGYGFLVVPEASESKFFCSLSYHVVNGVLRWSREPGYQVSEMPPRVESGHLVLIMKSILYAWSLREKASCIQATSGRLEEIMVLLNGAIAKSIGETR